jgi:hypothetical protein
LLRFTMLFVNVGTELIGSKLAGKPLSKEFPARDRQDCSPLAAKPSARLDMKGPPHAAEGHTMEKLLRGGERLWN